MSGPTTTVVTYLTPAQVHAFNVLNHHDNLITAFLIFMSIVVSISFVILVTFWSGRGG